MGSLTAATINPGSLSLRRRPRQRRHDREAAASLAAALEQIFISEPVMAASSSSGGDGLSLPLSLYSNVLYVLDLGTLLHS